MLDNNCIKKALKLYSENVHNTLNIKVNIYPHLATEYFMEFCIELRKS